MFTVYVLINPEGRLYIGQTENLQERLEAHNMGLAKWTSSRGPWTLGYTEVYPTRAEAIRRERQLKSGRANQDLRQRLADTSRNPGASASPDAATSP